MATATDWKILDGARDLWAQFSPNPPWTLDELVAKVRTVAPDLRRYTTHNRKLRLRLYFAVVDGMAVKLVVQMNEAGESWRLRRAYVASPR